MKTPPLSSSGFVLASTAAVSDSTLPAKVTPPAQLAKISDFKETLATAELVDPTAPSVAVYTVHSTDKR